MKDTHPYFDPYSFGQLSWNKYSSISPHPTDPSKEAQQSPSPLRVTSKRGSTVDPKSPTL